MSFGGTGINFETTDNSHNNVIIGWLSFGFGWHNNHHSDPKNWNFSEKWWQLDLAALLIKGIKK